MARSGAKASRARLGKTVQGRAGCGGNGLRDPLSGPMTSAPGVTAQQHRRPNDAVLTSRAAVAAPADDSAGDSASSTTSVISSPALPVDHKEYEDDQSTTASPTDSHTPRVSPFFQPSLPPAEPQQPAEPAAELPAELPVEPQQPLSDTRNATTQPPPSPSPSPHEAKTPVPSECQTKSQETPVLQAAKEVAAAAAQFAPLPAPADAMPQPRATDEQIACGLAALLTQIVAATSDTRPMSCFHAVRQPNMTILAYMQRISRFWCCSGACYVLGMMYIDRLVQRFPDVVISPLSCHRLLLTSMTVAAKFHDDVFYSNEYYAKVGGVRVPEINVLEARFVKMLDYKLHVQPEEYRVYEEALLNASNAVAIPYQN